MKKFKRSLLFMLLCAVPFGLIMENQLKTDQSVQDIDSLNRLLSHSSEIQRIWYEGEESKEWQEFRKQCLKLRNITKSFDESILRCNPFIIDCLTELNTFKNFKVIKNETHNSYFKILTKANSSHSGLGETSAAFTIQELNSKYKIDFSLELNCHEVYLEPRKYGYGEKINDKEVEDYEFDNFNRHIYIDRNLVTNYDINLWIDFSNDPIKSNLLKKNGDDLFLPASHLTYHQMENYCSFRGKQLLLAHYFDAATFLPIDLSITAPEEIQRGPHYWTKKNAKFNKNCEQIYTSECLKEKPFRLNQTGPTWAGLMDPMGGYFEALRNPIDPASNMKASSQYFNSTSPWHRLGFRAGWDGTGFSRSHFDFRGLDPDYEFQEFNIGFRCMKEDLP